MSPGCLPSDHFRYRDVGAYGAPMEKTLLVEGLTEADARQRALAMASRDYDEVHFHSINREHGSGWAVHISVFPEVLLP